MKLRLLVRPDCDRACPGCCNKSWDLNALPVCSDYRPYDEIMLTGGEPMLDPQLVHQTIRDIRAQNETAKLFMYTARVLPVHELGIVLHNLDGVTVTLHEQKDVEPFLRFAHYAALWKLQKGRTLRVNVFKPIVLREVPDLRHWIVKAGMEWIVDCPLPGEEVFMRIAHGMAPDTIAPELHWTGR